MTYLAVFLAMVALDFCYGEYTKSAADRRALPASGWAAALYAIGGFVTVNYIGDHWMLVPATCGAFVGTYLSIRFVK